MAVWQQQGAAHCREGQHILRSFQLEKKVTRRELPPRGVNEASRMKRVVVWLLLPVFSAGALLQQSAWNLVRSAALAATPHRAPASVCLAKKKGSGKGNTKQKKSGFEWASNFELQPYESSEKRALAETLCTTHETRTGKPVHPSIVDASDVPKALWKAPIACLIVAPAPAPVAATAAEDGDAAAGGAGETAADVEAASPPEYVYAYANVAALEVHGLQPTDYNSLIGQEAALPGTWGSAKKYEGNYSKKLSPPGVVLAEATRWPLEKVAVVGGKLSMQTVGIAYAFGSWELEDGSICEPGGLRRARELSAEEVAAAVEAQAAEVRRLKDTGLGNKDAEVVQAVGELLRLKALQAPA
jgi:hypothetical protein